ncbi:tetratricopeptide repeat protein, partial [Streptomyces sp. NPDC005271]|uniref:tetratricopeptide repeat protein n=1 Tax=Streptomyces sp. NPDC005271 TaxID=3157030 RepID=UPI00339E118D
MEAPYWLAKALRGLGRTEEAEPWLRRAVEAHPEVVRGYGGMTRLALPDPRRELAEVLTELGRAEAGAAGGCAPWPPPGRPGAAPPGPRWAGRGLQIGRASCRE